MLHKTKKALCLSLMAISFLSLSAQNHDSVATHRSHEWKLMLTKKAEPTKIKTYFIGQKLQGLTYNRSPHRFAGKLNNINQSSIEINNTIVPIPNISKISKQKSKGSKVVGHVLLGFGLSVLTTGIFYQTPTTDKPPPSSGPYSESFKSNLIILGSVTATLGCVILIPNRSRMQQSWKIEAVRINTVESNPKP